MSPLFIKCFDPDMIKFDHFLVTEMQSTIIIMLLYDFMFCKGINKMYLIEVSKLNFILYFSMDSEVFPSLAQSGTLAAHDLDGEYIQTYLGGKLQAGSYCAKENFSDQLLFASDISFPTIFQSSKISSTLD